MKPITMALVAGAGALALTTSAVSAEVICNAEGDCWHAKTHSDYRPELRLNVHPDNWKWSENEHHNWREHEGRGYWHSGIWIKL